MVNEIYSNYIDGTLLEKLENYGVDIKRYECLDIMTQFQSHKNFKKACEIVKENGEELIIDYFWNDMYVNCDLQDYEILQDLVDNAWEEVQTERYFVYILSKLNKDILYDLYKIYH